MSLRKRLPALLLALSLSSALCAQVPYGPIKPTAPGEILSNLKKLNVLGSVLYVAAHPDDENTLLLAYLAKDRLVRTGYLSLTRGDGGQNLIGPEQGENIGVIRTQELLAARRVDGPDQFFSRAYDFGFSKSTNEAVRTWGQDKVLADVVWMIRKYQPDVIITRFPPDARAGHGHHSASGFLAEEAFKISNDPTKFPEQLAFVKPWQAKRIFWNMFIPGAFLSNKKPDEAGNLVGVETGLYNPLLGKSYGEIASESRSQHKSQGFGVAPNRGAKIDYFLLKGGNPVEKDPLEGVDLSWKRMKNSDAVQALVTQTIASFRPDQPAASVPALVQLYGAISKLDTTNIYVKAKRQEVQTLLQQCLGLWFETNPADYAATPGETIKISTNIVSRVDAPVKLQSIHYSTGKDTTLNLALKPNDVILFPTTLTIPKTQAISQPYWLEKPIDKGLFQVDNQQLIGLPENPAAVTASYTFEIGGQSFTYSRPVVYKSTDPVDGEIYRPFIIQPAVTANLTERVYVFADNTPKTAEIVLKAGQANQSGTLKLDVPAGWRVEPASAPFSLTNKGDEQRVTFSLSPTAQAKDGKLQAVMTTATGTFTTGLRLVAYKHIPTQTLFPPASAKLVKLDVKVTAKNIGYIVGAGDEVPAALQQMGCRVTLLGPNDLIGNLAGYDAIVVGVRAYNTNSWMARAQPKLMDYVKNGGTMIVQYVTPVNSFFRNEAPLPQLGPYPFKVVNERVTEEDAPMTFINPQHSLLNFPNKITEADFSGWIQERGIYFGQDWDKAYEPIFSANDQNEAPKQGSLLYAKYGKGHFMYTGLVFFRELPAGVPGAYRLFANMISVGSNNAASVSGSQSKK
ncbi:PIG-L family deacetylase [Spirosoma sp. KCTC 42546]|uniref:PIG-L family deacetylase n=1 Tax=Spirosoma sp. KCTC 42546 TaxID=2520506 RepID=UPI00115BF32B|nr:PIG-L family deacetylase [Spirosoma sp. KCTC 42546]QDK81205.1 PIG-L family deacetylase [Spirosoma sp. KCTC 42546]